MKIKIKTTRFPIVSCKRVRYNKNKVVCKQNMLKRREGRLVTEFAQKLDKIQLPPHILRELGLEKDWQKKVSPEFIHKVVKTAEKYKDVLKELSKY
ncbi:hypothetical protein Ga0451573_003395 [Peptococcaceae bacterium DYL19]|nr:hypothetical protein [Phosphitispora fastidiosa]